jgi:hypothetical protein
VRNRLCAGHSEVDPARVERVLHLLEGAGGGRRHALSLQAGGPLLAWDRPRLDRSAEHLAHRAGEVVRTREPSSTIFLPLQPRDQQAGDLLADVRRCNHRHGAIGIETAGGGRHLKPACIVLQERAGPHKGGRKRQVAQRLFKHVGRSDGPEAAALLRSDRGEHHQSRRISSRSMCKHKQGCLSLIAVKIVPH